jgi:hypothetical protein
MKEEWKEIFKRKCKVKRKTNTRVVKKKIYFAEDGKINQFKNYS